jgi:glutathione S-transferase
MARNSPNGQVAILKLPDGRMMAETIDICKYLAQLPSPEASCPLLCDETQCSIFRIANTVAIIWDRKAGPDGGSPENSAWLVNVVPWSEAKQVLPRYRSRIMPVLKDFEAKLSASGGPFFSAATPGIGDLCLFAYMDNIKTPMPDMPDAVGPCLTTRFDACAKLPRVA